jgi:hypothetical protein
MYHGITFFVSLAAGTSRRISFSPPFQTPYPRHIFIDFKSSPSIQRFVNQITSISAPSKVKTKKTRPRQRKKCKSNTFRVNSLVNSQGDNGIPQKGKAMKKR